MRGMYDIIYFLQGKEWDLKHLFKSGVLKMIK